ncbi:MAG: hypothetical protein AAF915_26125 [Cyanobacteria bacterium P01_D01_bin.50]
MTNIKDYPELTEVSNQDWLLIQENKTIPAYKKVKLINLFNQSSDGGIAVTWNYKSGNTDVVLNAGANLFIDTPRDVVLDLTDVPEGSEIQIQQIGQKNSIILKGITKVRGNDITDDTTIFLRFSEIPTKLIHLNSSLGWFFLPSSNTTILSPLSLPEFRLIQLFDSTTIVANDFEKIAQWNDSINSRHASQTNESNQARYVNSIFGNGSVGGVLFEGSEDYVVDLSYLAGEKYTIAIVEARTYDHQAYIIGNSSGGTNKALHVGYRGDTQFTLAQYSNDLDAGIEPFANTLNPTIWIVSNSSRGKEILRNGILIASDNDTVDLVEMNNGRLGCGSFNVVTLRK